MNNTIQLRGGLSGNCPTGWMGSFDELSEWFERTFISFRSVRIHGGHFLDEGYTVIPVFEETPTGQSGGPRAVPAPGRIRRLSRFLADITMYVGEKLLEDGGYVALSGTVRANGCKVVCLEAEWTNHATYVFLPSDDDGRPPDEAFWKRSRIRAEMPSSFVGRAEHGPQWAVRLAEAFYDAASRSG